MQCKDYLLEKGKWPNTWSAPQPLLPVDAVTICFAKTSATTQWSTQDDRHTKDQGRSKKGQTDQQGGGDRCWRAHDPESGISRRYNGSHSLPPLLILGRSSVFICQILNVNTYTLNHNIFLEKLTGGWRSISGLFEGQLQRNSLRATNLPSMAHSLLLHMMRGEIVIKIIDFLPLRQAHRRCLAAKSHVRKHKFGLFLFLFEFRELFLQLY